MVKKVSFYQLNIPFIYGYDHSQVSRLKGDSVIVELEFADGSCTYGECTPRVYVTGESLDSIIAVISQKKELLSKVEKDFEAIVALEKVWGDTDNAAFCAIEAALLQWVAGEAGVQKFMKIAPQPIEFSATLTGGKREDFLLMAQGFAKNEMRDVKMKLVDDNKENLWRVDYLRELYQGDLQLRVDGNELWSFDENHSQLKALIEKGVDSFEQPFAKDDLASCDQFMKTFGGEAKLILDDSITTWKSYEQHTQNQLMTGVNVKVSKNGGYLRTKRIVDACIADGMHVQLGCHVGETSLLGYFGSLLGFEYGKELAHFEGGFSTHLLTEDPVTPHVQFGFKGKLETLPQRLNVEMKLDPVFVLNC